MKSSRNHVRRTKHRQLTKQRSRDEGKRQEKQTELLQQHITRNWDRRGEETEEEGMSLADARRVEIMSSRRQTGITE